MWASSSFGDFSSGEVSVGSIKLEVIEGNSTTRWCIPQSPPRIQGIAFRPSRTVDDAFLAEVDQRAVPHTSPQHYPRWTNVYFQGLVSDLAGAFVCDYHVPEPKDVDMRRRLLAEAHGGRLGVLDAVELVIATPDLDAAAARWQRLLDPLQPAAPHLWRPMLGPAIRLVPGSRDQVDHLVLAVRSIIAAQDTWNRVGTGALRGFPLRFVERSNTAARCGQRRTLGNCVPGTAGLVVVT